ncbi:MAG: DUF5522 domain-containing protein [Myxococcota bacterium]|nr:DUF5522 domain-containing protein [Myxococcota bacterium]
MKAAQTVKVSEAAKRAHDQACAAGEQAYSDPASGYRVMTADYLLSQKVCCDSGCRHCPFGAPV